jgi:hypothetical protein
MSAKNAKREGRARMLRWTTISTAGAEWTGIIPTQNGWTGTFPIQAYWMDWNISHPKPYNSLQNTVLHMPSRLEFSCRSNEMQFFHVQWAAETFQADNYWLI